MVTIQQAIDDLRSFFELEGAAKAGRKKSLEDIGIRNPARQDEVDKILTKQVDDWGTKIRGTLEDLLRFPPYHGRHWDKIKGFYAPDSNYDRSVFIMTKYPDGTDPIDLELKRVIDSARSAIRDAGYHPMLASDKQHHPILWDNIELYLSACGKGVAIVEDRYKPELNPNVAIEWGWMRGLGKEVLFLMEKEFRHNRADWEGFIRDDFSWNDPETAITSSIKKWLAN